jgi:hypothetical protein
MAYFLVLNFIGESLFPCRSRILLVYTPLRVMSKGLLAVLDSEPEKVIFMICVIEKRGHQGLLCFLGESGRQSAVMMFQIS